MAETTSENTQAICSGYGETKGRGSGYQPSTVGVGCVSVMSVSANPQGPTLLMQGPSSLMVIASDRSVVRAPATSILAAPIRIGNRERLAQSVAAAPPCWGFIHAGTEPSCVIFLCQGARGL